MATRDGKPSTDRTGVYICSLGGFGYANIGGSGIIVSRSITEGIEGPMSRGDMTRYRRMTGLNVLRERGLSYVLTI